MKDTSSNDGRMFTIPRNRRLTWDLLHFNRSVPQCGHSLVMNLSGLAEARAKSDVRISWPALFLKAYALVAMDKPELRQTWYRWPFAHLYQHPSSVGVLTVQREYKGSSWLFWGRIQNPENQSLKEIQEQIDRFQTGLPQDLFRNEIRMAAFPTFVRRLIWSWNIHVAKPGRSRQLGTFFVSTLSGRGVEIAIPPSIQTGCLTYGPLSDLGQCRVTIAYDHRVMDGVAIAECLKQLEVTLLQTVRLELLKLKPSEATIQDVA